MWIARHLYMPIYFWFDKTTEQIPFSSPFVKGDERGISLQVSSSCRFGNSQALPARHRFAFLCQRRHQLIERSGERRHPVLLKLFGDHVQVDADGLQATEGRRCFVETVPHGIAD